MRTTVTIDDAIFAELMQLTRAKSRTEAIRLALTEWVRRQKIERLKALRGKVTIEGDLDGLRRLDIEEASLDG